ncbi:transposase domain-containing protein [Streptomyces sp. NPDC006012]|uniref:transposase domain-containing protein n=1 Tax=Streptomyces sp. NPDC006012 TaxID=3364739 RepID=UPI003673EF30
MRQLAMCLFFGQPYEEVSRLLGAGLGDAGRSWRVPTTAAIGRARRRLGVEPLKLLFARVCRPVAVPQTVGAWYRRWRLVAVDGTTLDLADTAENDSFFGRPGSGRGTGAFPQARVVALAESRPRRRFPPGRLARALTRTLAEIAERLLPARRHRTCPRVIRRKMSNWPLKRAEHRNWTPPAPHSITITRRDRT